jgi:hypothetical protein
MIRRLIAPACAALAILIVMRKLVVWWLAGAATPLTALLSPYNLAILSYDYFHNGFVRRGLGGTLVAMLGGGSDHPAAAVLFFLLSAVFLAVPLVLLMRRLQALPGWSVPWIELVLVASPQLFWGWGQDLARADMLVAGFVAWGAIAALERRYMLALALAGFGYAAHDTAVIYGSALVAAIWLTDYRVGATRIADGARAVAVLVAVLAAILAGQTLFGDVPGAIRTMLARYPTNPDAAYYTFGGMRTAWQSACGSFSRPGVYLYIGGAFAVLALYVPALLYRRPASLLFFAIAALAPMIFITIVAIDYGRWLIFAVHNAWIGAIVLRLRGVEPVRDEWRAYGVAAAALLVLMAMRSTAPLYPNMALAEWADTIWGQHEPLGPDQCDPGWRSILPEGPAA